MTAKMGNTESRFGDNEVNKCIESIEDELLTGGYDDGVTPESVVMCLRTMLMAARNGGGNIVVPKAMGVAYERDVVVSCTPAPKSRHSGSSRTLNSRGWERRGMKPPGSAYATSVVESAGGTAMTASEARKMRMQKRSEESRRQAPSRRASISASRRHESATGGHVAKPESTALMDDTMEQLAGLNIRRVAEPVPLSMPPQNEPPIFRGPPTQRGVGGVRDRARAMEGRV